MEIKQLDESRKSDWDTFVNDCAEATFFISPVGGRSSNGLLAKTHYLFAEDEGRIVGVLPLGHVRSLLFGNA